MSSTILHTDFHSVHLSFFFVCYTITCFCKYRLLPRKHCFPFLRFAEEERKLRRMLLLFPAMIPWLHTMQTDHDYLSRSSRELGGVFSRECGFRVRLIGGCL
jgi:hypothetical protein